MLWDYLFTGNIEWDSEFCFARGSERGDSDMHDGNDEGLGNTTVLRTEEVAGVLAQIPKRRKFSHQVST